jgi:hypothetical protein
MPFSSLNFFCFGKFGVFCLLWWYWGFELRVLHFLDRGSTTRAMTQALSALVIFQIRS